MSAVFYISAVIAVASTFMVITRRNAVHALLYLVVSLLALAVVFYTLGAPFAAALEVIVYAGAIMVLFVFVVMLLNLGPRAEAAEREWLRPRGWLLPFLLAGCLLLEMIYLFSRGSSPLPRAGLGPREVGLSLFGPYLIGVELASMLLLAGLVGAYHLGVPRVPEGRAGWSAGTGTAPGTGPGPEPDEPIEAGAGEGRPPETTASQRTKGVGP